jgi:hypothetical protein
MKEVTLLFYINSRTFSSLYFFFIGDTLRTIDKADNLVNCAADLELTTAEMNQNCEVNK